jgi:hypothetical protein
MESTFPEHPSIIHESDLNHETGYKRKLTAKPRSGAPSLVKISRRSKEQ